MDDLHDIGPVLLPEEQAKQDKIKRRKEKLANLHWPFSKKRTLIVGCALCIIAISVSVILLAKKTVVSTNSGLATTSIPSKDTKITQSKTVSGLQLNPRLLYGDKYANGILPVGDGKYVTDAPKKGYVYLCKANFVPEGQAGAQKRGPWFVNNNTQWDINKKARVKGSVDWEQKVSQKIEGGKRVITTNNLPDHQTGEFPVASNDPAHAYDSNPNTIKEQQLTYNLNAGPGMSNTPNCMEGEAGVMLTGVALFNAFDAGGRDAGAWEVQDNCDGHPQESGEYHYHTLSRCIKDVSVQTVIGYALDGFPITGPKVEEGSILTTDDLDACHGIASQIILDGVKTTAYHYVMTQDFPYSVSCFQSKPTTAPGQHGPQAGQTQNTPQPQGSKPKP